MIPIVIKSPSKDKEQEEYAEKAMKLAQKAVQCMTICTCIAYERFDVFEKTVSDLENMNTPLGQKFLQRVMPIVVRREDTVEAFVKDMMLAARDVVQEYLTDDISESEE